MVVGYSGILGIFNGGGGGCEKYLEINVGGLLAQTPLVMTFNIIFSTISIKIIYK